MLFLSHAQGQQGELQPVERGGGGVEEETAEDGKNEGRSAQSGKREGGKSHQ